MEFCKYCSGIPVQVKHCHVPSHIELRKPDLCPYCVGVEVSQCEVQEHWERRLRAYNLMQDDSIDKPDQVQMRLDGEKSERLVPLTGAHEQHADIKALPKGWHSATSGDVEARFSNTSYRNINVYERCPSPKYNSAGFQIEASC